MLINPFKTSSNILVRIITAIENMSFSSIYDGLQASGFGSTEYLKWDIKK
jgi:hypothetical protein